VVQILFFSGGAMKPFLMGTEAEYAVSGADGAVPLAAETVYALLSDAVRRQHRWAADANGRNAVYLENGGRLYLDSGGHPEYATPECPGPAEAAAHDKAGEFLLARARDLVRAARPGLRLTVVKNNLDPVEPDAATWGCHESYTSWAPLDAAAPVLVPHLASRVVYAGAGCLSAAAEGGFELSQRARHMAVVLGHDTMQQRALFCLRIRKPSDFSRGGWVRAHLIAKDSQRAPFGIYLTLGVTGLLFALLNEQRPVGRGLALADPLRALRAFSCDPWLRTRAALADGRKLTALEIQECYLSECERALVGAGLPGWAGEVVRAWRDTLADLARDPLRLAGRLDPYCKLHVLGHELRRAGRTWAELRAGLAALARLRRVFPPEVVGAVLDGDPGRLAGPAREAYSRALAEAGPGELPRLAVRLQALDLSYHELGGLHDRLAEAGRLEAVVLSAGDAERASREPPAGARAALRGAEIRALPPGAGWVADWRFLYHPPTRTYVDLRSPFQTERRTAVLEELPPEDWPGPWARTLPGGPAAR
jgi:hypothetical protein